MITLFANCCHVTEIEYGQVMLDMDVAYRVRPGRRTTHDEPPDPGSITFVEFTNVKMWFMACGDTPIPVVPVNDFEAAKMLDDVWRSRGEFEDQLERRCRHHAEAHQ